MAAELPGHARVVIIGGGIIGCSIAYHLTKHGWSDVVVLEQGRLSGGTTWHAAGLVGQLRAHPNMTRLIQHSTELYSRLEEETGQRIEFKLHPFDDLEAELQRGVSQLRSSPFLVQRDNIKGVIYDVDTGRLRTVVE